MIFLVIDAVYAVLDTADLDRSRQPEHFREAQSNLWLLKTVPVDVSWQDLILWQLLRE